MISVRCKLNDENLYSIVDKEFLNANMKKISDGNYIGDEDTFNTSFFAIRKLLENNSLVKAIKSFTRDCGDEEEDLMEYYKYLVTNRRI